MTSDESMLSVFEQYVRQYHKDLLRFASHLLRQNLHNLDVDQAEDLVQETLTIAWERRETFLASPSPAGWLYQTLKNVLRNAIRQEQRWTIRLLQAQQVAPTDVLPPPGGDLELEGFVPDEDLDLLKRLYLHGETYDELAQELGLKKSALAMRIHRIKEVFRKKYQETETFSSSACEQTTSGRHDNSRGGFDA